MFRKIYGIGKSFIFGCGFLFLWIFGYGLYIGLVRNTSRN